MGVCVCVSLCIREIRVERARAKKKESEELERDTYIFISEFLRHQHIVWQAHDVYYIIYRRMYVFI